MSLEVVCALLYDMYRHLTRLTRTIATRSEHTYVKALILHPIDSGYTYFISQC